MFGRRSHPRFGVLPPAAGRVRVLRDVAVRHAHGQELVAFSLEPAASGDTLRLDVDQAGTRVSLNVEVVESRPIVVDGSVRHELRLRVCGTSSK